MPHEDAFHLLNHCINISKPVFARLVTYHDLLLKWQKKINLISSDSLQDVWKRHFLDSLQLMKFIPEESTVIIDIGSGAGFPGMALAIAGVRNIHLVESDGKKISFLQEIKRSTGTEVELHHDRIEKISLGKADIILARACSDLDQLLGYASPHVSHETICLFPKGKNYAKELEDAKRDWSFDYKVIPSVTDNQAVILILSSIERRQL